MKDPINPNYYKENPVGIECIEITKHLNFCLGNALKYIWRVGFGGKEDNIQDLKKAIWYLNKQI